ncbi:MAG: sigma-54 dependent transcriptional regulator, partial [Deltaproteobacteria bacterium]
MAQQKILVVDDEKSMCEFLEIMLKKDGYEVATTTSGEEALGLLDKNLYSMVLTDVKMPGVNGFDVLRKTKEVSPDTVVIMITAYGSPEGAVTAIKEGAYDYVTKPFRVEEVKLTIKKSLERSNLIRENIRLRQAVEERYKFWNLIGKSPKMQRVYELVEKVSQTKANVLITGESGTGKELVAKAIHYNSARKDQSFVTLNCGAIPENLLESELFGHMKGSFTGAIANKRGLLEMAAGGTLFMDEIGELPLPLQVKLLRVIQEREFKRVGGTEDIKVDVRIISASNQDEQQKVAQGSFREDLFYRLNV